MNAHTQPLVFWFGPSMARAPIDGRAWPDPLTAARNAPHAQGAHLWSASRDERRNDARRLPADVSANVLQAVAQRALLSVPPADRGQFFAVPPVDVVVRACRVRAEREAPATMAADVRADLIRRLMHEYIDHFASVSRVLACTEFARSAAA